MLTGWIFHFPHAFGMSYGTMLLIGPLLYFYTKSITRPEFVWKWVFLMHGVPYGVNLLLVVSMFLLAPEKSGPSGCFSPVNYLFARLMQFCLPFNVFI